MRRRRRDHTTTLLGHGNSLPINEWLSVHGLVSVQTDVARAVVFFAMTDPLDILLLPDGTWRLRKECRRELLRDCSYRVIKCTRFECHRRARVPQTTFVA